MKSSVSGANGVPISYEESGRPVGEAPTIVLVHGWPDDMSVWDAVIPHLTERFHVVNYDPRGSGESGHPRRVRDYTLDLLSEDFEAVIDATAGERPVHVLAHDWGAIQTWESAVRIPERFASLTVVSGPSLDLTGKSLRLLLKQPKRYPDLIRQSLASTYIVFNYLPVLPEIFWRSGVGNKVADWLVRKLDGFERGPYSKEDGAAQTNLYRANIFQRLVSPRPAHTRVEVPVQQIVPTKDIFVTDAYHEGLNEAVPQLRRREIDGGHWVIVTKPETIAQWTAEYVEEFSEV